MNEKQMGSFHGLLDTVGGELTPLLFPSRIVHKYSTSRGNKLGSTKVTNEQKNSKIPFT